jgi:hypothetical protein
MNHLYSLPDQLKLIPMVGAIRQGKNFSLFFALFATFAANLPKSAFRNPQSPFPPALSVANLFNSSFPFRISHSS